MADAEFAVRYGVLNELTDTQKRTALTPDTVTRLKRSSVECFVETGSGRASFYTDEDFEKAGARVVSRSEVLNNSDVLGFVGRPNSDDIAEIKPGTWVIGALNSWTDEEYIRSLENAGITAIAMERLPRQLSSAQSMDEMTSQNSVMGYKAVLKAADAYASLIPMMTTAAGTIRPAKVLVLGAGIAGLQAIGTAKRLGAVVTGYDVRPAAREEVESLGAKFLDLGLDFADQGEGGYARELTDDERAAQQAAVDERASQFDIIITTARVPGRKPPVLLTSTGVSGLHRGAVVVDCAASEFGGNVEGSCPNETVVTDGGVTILGLPYLASEVATTASDQIARNLADTLVHFMRGEEKKLIADITDEIDDAMVVTQRDNSSLNLNLKEVEG